MIKKLRERSIVFLSMMILWLLLDEYVKEGYFFDPKDVINGNITHEKIIVAMLIALVVLLVKSLKL